MESKDKSGVGLGAREDVARAGASAPAPGAQAKGAGSKVGWVDRMCSGRARWAALAVSVAMGVGAAVNEGFSAWTMAIPFGYLIWRVASLADRARARQLAAAGGVAEPRVATRRLCAFAFFAVVIGVSTTQYRNPWLYPILEDGYAEALTDGKIGSYPGDGESDLFLDAYADAQVQAEIPAKDRGMGYQERGRYAKGTRFRVVGVYGDTGDLYQRVGLVLSDGRLVFRATQDQWADTSAARAAMAQSQIGRELFGQKIKPSKPVQAPWAKSMGQLMMWPFFPMAGLSLLSPTVAP